MDEVSLDNLSGSNSTVFLSERGASMMPQVDESGGTNYRPVSNVCGICFKSNILVNNTERNY